MDNIFTPTQAKLTLSGEHGSRNRRVITFGSQSRTQSYSNLGEILRVYNGEHWPGVKLDLLAGIVLSVNETLMKHDNGQAGAVIYYRELCEPSVGWLFYAPVVPSAIERKSWLGKWPSSRLEACQAMKQTLFEEDQEVLAIQVLEYEPSGFLRTFSSRLNETSQPSSIRPSWPGATLVVHKNRVYAMDTGVASQRRMQTTRQDIHGRVLVSPSYFDEDHWREGYILDQQPEARGHGRELSGAIAVYLQSAWNRAKSRQTLRGLAALLDSLRPSLAGTALSYSPDTALPELNPNATSSQAEPQSENATHLGKGADEDDPVFVDSTSGHENFLLSDSQSAALVASNNSALQQIDSQSTTNRKRQHSPSPLQPRKRVNRQPSAQPTPPPTRRRRQPGIKNVPQPALPPTITNNYHINVTDASALNIFYNAEHRPVDPPRTLQLQPLPCNVCGGRGHPGAMCPEKATATNDGVIGTVAPAGTKCLKCWQVRSRDHTCRTG